MQFSDAILRGEYKMRQKSEFVNSLISQMTIKEKIGQITMLVSGMNTYDRHDGKFTFRPQLK